MRKPAGTALALLALAALIGAAPTAAAPATWGRAHLVRLPEGGTSVDQGFLPALACPAVGDCVAAGDYQDAASNIVGLAVTETRGVWATAQSVGAPAGAASASGLTPYAAACGSVGDCVIVGDYDDASGDVQAFVDQEVKGVWRGAAEVTLPGDALGDGQVATLNAVDCASATSCVAVGSYRSAAADEPVEGLLVEGHGTSWVAYPVGPPAGANVNPVINLNHVACATTASCVAAGTYVDADNATHGLVVSAAGAAMTGTALFAPPNASAFSSVAVGGMACAAAGECTVDGTYETAGGQLEGFAAASTGGSWARASELSMPAGAAANPRVFFYGFTDLACHAPGNCTTGGQYVDAAGDYQGFLDNEVAGVWRDATTLRLPAGAQQAGHNGGVVAITCPASGACRAGAAYLDAKGQYQTFVVAERADAWSPGTTLTLPAGATTVGVDGGIYGLVCRSVTACTATGSFLDGSGNYQGFDAVLG